MATRMVLDSAQVQAIASSMERDNNELRELLNNSKNTINGLSSVWTGQAAEETRAACEAFSNKFFQTYQDVITQYVTFLRRNVAEQYEQVEQANVRLSDIFK